MTNTAFNITVIQGDDVNFVYQFVDANGNILNTLTISTVYMTCSDLNFQTTLTYDTLYQGFALSIPAATTATFAQMLTNYDLTVYFIDDIIQTEVYDAKLQVLLKKNKVVI